MFLLESLWGGGVGWDLPRLHPGSFSAVKRSAATAHLYYTSSASCAGYAAPRYVVLVRAAMTSAAIANILLYKEERNVTCSSSCAGQVAPQSPI